MKKEMIKKDKRGAMEMALGTVVTMVLLISVLVLGLFFIKNIYHQGVKLADTINEAVHLEIEKIFAESDALIVVYPRTKIIELKRGSKNNGFAFALNNINSKDTEFKWKVFVDPEFDIENSDCEISPEEAERWMLQKEGKKFLPGNSDSSQNPELILFSVPRSAKLCIIPYKIKIYDEQDKEYANYDVKIEIKR